MIGSIGSCRLAVAFNNSCCLFIRSKLLYGVHRELNVMNSLKKLVLLEKQNEASLPPRLSVSVNWAMRCSSAAQESSQLGVLHQARLNNCPHCFLFCSHSSLFLLATVQLLYVIMAAMKASMHSQPYVDLINDYVVMLIFFPRQRQHFSKM